MDYQQAIDQDLVPRLGEGNAHLVWALSLFLDVADPEALAADALTDRGGDRKIDFLYTDVDRGRIVVAQGYYSDKWREAAKSNKAADLNTACAWLFKGDLELVPEEIRPSFAEARDAIESGHIDNIELLYVHNCGESQNVTEELNSAAAYLRSCLDAESEITVTSRELGAASIEELWATRDQHILVNNRVAFPGSLTFEHEGPKWKAAVVSVPAEWLRRLYATYNSQLFSANFREFLGSDRRHKINSGIKETAEKSPEDFWVYNNGITVLTRGADVDGDGQTWLDGISVINGAQTTGSIGQVVGSLENARVLCRVVQVTDPKALESIVRYNNTQNAFKTWDQYANDKHQRRLRDDFQGFNLTYASKRGFDARQADIVIDEVMQPLLAFQGRFADAVRGRGRIFEESSLYDAAFARASARHILFVHSLAKAIDEFRLGLKGSSGESLIDVERRQLGLLTTLRFKPFLVTIIGQILESLLGKKVSLAKIGFTPNAVSQMSTDQLRDAWVPVVRFVLPLLIGAMDSSERVFPSDFRTDTAVLGLAKTVASFVYATKTATDFSDFEELVAVD